MFDHITTMDELKRAYRAAAKKAHPDLGGSDEAMKAVNNAYDEAAKRLSQASYNDYKARQEENGWNVNKTAADFEAEAQHFRETLAKVIFVNAAEIEIVGTWLWVTFTGGKPPQEARDAVKAAGFRWASNKKKWCWHDPQDGYKKRSRTEYSMDEIRAKYGSAIIKRAPSEYAPATV